MSISSATRYLTSLCLFVIAGCASTGAPHPMEQNLNHFQFNAHLKNELVLSGHLPDEAAQTSLINLAASIFPNTEIVSDMDANGASVSGWHRTTRWGLSSLSKLEEGKLVIVDHTLHLEGLAAKAEIKAAVEAATIGLKTEIEHSVVISVVE